MPNWTTLHSIRGDQRYAFEELAYQIAKVIHSGEGRFVRVDDSGGGDGVEFYLVRQDGTEWGWQTKFFPITRLTASHRTQIIGSLKRACDVHPGLTRWTLCVPINLTPAEQKWFDAELPKVVPIGMKVALEHWVDSDFTAWLAEPRFVGKSRFFFGELELSLAWFRDQFDRQSASLKNRFDPWLHVETQVDEVVHNLLGDEEFVRRVESDLSLMDGHIVELENAIASLEQETFPEIVWGTARKELIHSANELLTAVKGWRQVLGAAHRLLVDHDFAAIRELEWESAEASLKASYKSYTAHAEDQDPYSLEYQGDASRRDSVTWRAYKSVKEPATLTELLRDEFAGLQAQLKFIDESQLHVFGSAGVGKTHLACHICEQRLQRELPALFARGVRFRSDDTLETQLRAIFDVPPSYSWNDFVEALATAGEAYETRIPLVIDGINESVFQGAFSTVWEADLPGLVTDLSNSGRLVLVTTCRPTYRTAIWPYGGPINQLDLNGFDSDDVERALAKYFEWYKITADTTLLSLSQLRNPIYLRMFCEITNPERINEVEAYIGQQSLYDILAKYVSNCNDLISRSLGKRREGKIAVHALAKLAAYMWSSNARFVALQDAYSIIDGQSLKDVNLETSLTEHLLAEGLLIERERLEEGEGIQFTFDLFGGYQIASYLVEANRADLLAFVQAPETSDKLFSDELRSRHPLADDIGRGLAALLPQRISGKYLHQAVDLPRARSLSLSALFEIDPELVSQQAVEYITRLFADENERRRLLELAASTISQTNHPLNAAYWSDRLMALAVADRDLTWTEHIRRNPLSFEQLALQLETASQQLTSSEVAQRRTHLVALWLRWVLTSSTPVLRDEVTRALYYYGRRWPTHLFNLLQESLNVDDPYVSERVLAATYGVAMALQFDSNDESFRNVILPKLGRLLYEAMFAPDAQHATTHFLTRDYAWRTIDIALRHHPEMLAAEEAKRARPPFEPDRSCEWGTAVDQGTGRYSDGNHPLARDHAGPIEDPMNALGPLGRNPNTREYRRLRSNLWWRIYGLGYSLDRFGKVDAAIARARPWVGWALEKWLTNPYGRKYALIAAYELAGYLDDRGKLRFDSAESPLSERPAFVDLDPSFPIEPRRCDVAWIDLLGDLTLPTADWLKARYDPDVSGYSVKDSICGNDGPWVLLAAHCVQQEPNPGRDVFFYVIGVVTSTQTAAKLKSRLLRRKQSIPIEARVPSTTYTFAGEVPWSDTYSNNPDIFSFPAGTVPAERLSAKTEVRQRGQLIPDDEASELLRTFFRQAFRERSADREQMPDIDSRIMELAREHGYEINTIEGVETYQMPKYEEIDGFLAVTAHGWESYHSMINEGYFVYSPTKEIAQRLGLENHPQTFDLFVDDGQLASVSFHPAQGSNKFSQTMCYLRKDLMDRYLEETDSALLWMVWGERQVLSPGSQRLSSKYRPFQSVLRYNSSCE